MLLSALLCCAALCFSGRGSQRSTTNGATTVSHSRGLARCARSILGTKTTVACLSSLGVIPCTQSSRLARPVRWVEALLPPGPDVRMGSLLGCVVHAAGQGRAGDDGADTSWKRATTSNSQAASPAPGVQQSLALNSPTRRSPMRGDGVGSVVDHTSVRTPLLLSCAVLCAVFRAVL